MRIDRSIEDVLYGRKQSVLVGPVLFILSVLYRLVVVLRSFLYGNSVLKSRVLPCRVISIGNITVGGTGKTPAVIQVAKVLQGQGKRVAVISRGYGRKNENEVLVVSDGKNVKTDTLVFGDEPVLIASSLPGVAVIVGADRHRAGQAALDRFKPDVLILDDGYQHVRLKRDLNIVLIDADDPFGSGRLFPAGILREPLQALARADVVLITRADTGRDLAAVRRVVGRHTAAPVFTASHVPTGVKDIRAGGERPLSSLRGTSLLAFSGIARPQSFFSLLRELGARIRKEVPFPDHYPFRPEDLDRIQRMAREAAADMIITTEKDAVRLRDLGPSGIWSLRIEQMVHEKDAWEAVVTNRT